MSRLLERLVAKLMVKFQLTINVLEDTFELLINILHKITMILHVTSVALDLRDIETNWIEIKIICISHFLAYIWHD